MPDLLADLRSTPEAPAGEIWLVRHGETEWSRNHKHTGRTDVPLTSDGEADAGRLGRRLGGVDFDLVLSSPRRRALDTARLAGFPNAESEPRAVEWDYGEYEGLTRAEISASVPDWALWTHGAPGGESPDGVAVRADALISRLRQGAPRVLLFAHAHFLRVLGVRWIGLPVGAAAHLLLDTASVSVLGWDRGTPVIRQWNA